MPPVLRYNTVRNANFTTSVGGTIADTDSVFANEGSDEYASGKDLSAYNLQRVTVGPGRGRGVGTSGAPLILQLDQTGSVFENLCGGVGAQEFVRSTSSSGVIRKILNNPAGNGSLNVASCDCGELVQVRGSVSVMDTADIASIYHLGGSGIYDESSYAATLMVVGGGGPTLKRSAATLRILANAMCVVDKLAAAFATATDVHGHLRVRKCGTHAAMTLEPSGLLDLTTLEQPFTITSLVSYEGSVIRRKRGHPVDVTISAHTPIGAGYKEDWV